MNALLSGLLTRLMRRGDITITDSDGQAHRYGDGDGPPVNVHIKTKRAERAIALDPMLAFPEAFMNEEVDFLEGDVLKFMQTVYYNMELGGVGAVMTGALETFRAAFRRLQQLNTASRAKRNVERHYDLSGDIYRLFLDADMQYSCAYFARPDMTLEEAQLAKKQHLAAKLRLETGQNVLDIGSGWGGLGLYLAENFDADVLGVTLSTEQHGVAVDRAHEAGLQDHVHFEIRDYRDLNERFDRIISVGMFEHVGVNHYRAFFDKCAKLLKPDGVMVLHTIGRTTPPTGTSAFIRKYIFPGGYIPSLSEMMPHIEKAGLVVNDIEILRFHYAETLKAWRERFLANRERAKAIYDERFCRMWEFYLAGSEASFRWQDLVNFQLQLTHKNNVLPITRDYIAEDEKVLAARQVAPAPPEAAMAVVTPLRAAE